MIRIVAQHIPEFMALLHHFRPLRACIYSAITHERPSLACNWTNIYLHACYPLMIAGTRAVVTMDILVGNKIDMYGYPPTALESYGDRCKRIMDTAEDMRRQLQALAEAEHVRVRREHHDPVTGKECDTD